MPKTYEFRYNYLSIVALESHGLTAECWNQPMMASAVKAHKSIPTPAKWKFGDTYLQFKF
jgi:hypothetical protein